MKRLLILKFGAIGDCIMAIPGAHAMHLAGFQVDWVCGQAVAPVLALYPWINLTVIDDRALLRGSLVEKLRALHQLGHLIGFRHYDIAATLYYDRRYKLLTLPVRATRKFLLSHTDRATMLIPGRHHTDEYARILSGRPDDVTPAQLAPIPPPRLPANPLPGVRDRSRIVLVPGGARNLMRDDALRRWPIELYVALATQLLALGHEVVLTGGPDDAWTSPHFAHLAVADLTGQLSLPATLALFESADLTITHDTGPLHLAGLTSTSLLTIFGPTDPHGRLPHRPNAVALWGGENFACRPCYDGRDYAPCSNNACVQQITPALALREATRLLAARAANLSLPPQIRVPSGL